MQAWAAVDARQGGGQQALAGATPVGVRKAYWEALTEMVRTLAFPPEYKQWTAMLAMKGDDEDPRDRSSRWSCGSSTSRTRVIDMCCVLDISISGRSSCPILFFADDASMISDSIAGLQLAFDCCWTVAKVCGLGTKIGPKSKHALEATRQQVRKKMVQILRVIGRIPVLQIYANARNGGLQHEHAYRVAAAALIDQIDRALPRMVAGAPEARTERR